MLASPSISILLLALPSLQGPTGKAFRWRPDTAPAERSAPALVRFRDGHALRFTRARRTRLVLGEEDQAPLRLTGPLTIRVVVRLDAPPPTKVALVSKWKLTPTGRSYELGVTSSRQLFFTVSASGTWPRGARELTSTRPLRVGVPYAVAAVFHPGERMELHLNGVPSGEARTGVPPAIRDTATPVLFGNRAGGERTCAFDGLLQAVWIHGTALAPDAIAAWSRAQRLTDPPEPELVPLAAPYDLDRVRDRVREWYAPLQAPGGPYGAYRLTADHPPDLYASADIAWIRWMMVDLDCTSQQRRQWIEFLQDQQVPKDGSYRHVTGHCATHAFCHATGALNMLGGKHRHPPRLLDRYRDPARVESWLSRIDWVRQWGASHDIWGAGLPLVCTGDTPEEWKRAFFGWLDAEADPETGFWRRGVEARSALEYVGGAFHIWPIYAAVGRPLPYPRRVIDAVLQLQRSDGSFDGGFGYGNMDAVWVLDHLAERLDHRRQDVRGALTRNLHGLMRLYNEHPSRFFTGAHATESRIATLAILQHALPDLLVSRRPWQNPWAVKKLFGLRF